MCRVLDNSLFVRDRKKYTKISECATSFNSLYNKNNIIQDDIFNVLENYVARHDSARQFVVHDAFDTIKSSDVNVSWFTPYTIVLSAPADGADTKTRFAPASR